MPDAMPRPLHDPLRVASSLQAVLRQDGLSGSRLCKLVFLCDGWSLAILGQRLCDARILADDVGPSYREIASNGVQAEIDRLLGRPKPAKADLDPDQAEIVHHVAMRYGGLATHDLRRATTSPSGSWWRTYLSRGGRGSTIPTELVHAEFDALAEASRAARSAVAA